MLVMDVREGQSHLRLRAMPPQILKIKILFCLFKNFRKLKTQKYRFAPSKNLILYVKKLDKYKYLNRFYKILICFYFKIY